MLLLPPKGKKELLFTKLHLNEISEHLFVQCTWLKPVQQPGAPPTSPLDATHYVLGPSMDNVEAVKGKYIINVLDHIERPTAGQPHFYILSPADLVGIKNYVAEVALHEVDVVAGRTRPSPRLGEDRRLRTQIEDDPGEIEKTVTTTRSGRATKKLNLGQGR